MIEKETREETRRFPPGECVVAKAMVKELTGIEVSELVAGDITDNLDCTVRRNTQYQRKGADKARYRYQQRLRKQRAKVETDEQKLAKLKTRLLAGDPKHPGYNDRLRAAKKVVGIAVSLPVIARKKWSNEKFQKRMEEEGHTYNPAQWKGWLPYNLAQKVQKEVIGARSRGEYEFFVKLYDIKFLPNRPDAVYLDDWPGWTDFLGTTNTFGANIRLTDPNDPTRLQYKEFFEALAFARSLKIKTPTKWIEACKSGIVPMDIPIDPHNVYVEQFVDMDHWLGVSTAMDKVTGKLVAPDLWILYRDGRDDACWWAKLSEDKYKAFIQTAVITVARVYEFEGELSNQVWSILDSLSEPYENDVRERYVENNATFEQIKSELDNILKWSNI